MGLEQLTPGKCSVVQHMSKQVSVEYSCPFVSLATLMGFDSVALYKPCQPLNTAHLNLAPQKRGNVLHALCFAFRLCQTTGPEQRFSR